MRLFFIFADHCVFKTQRLQGNRLKTINIIAAE